MLANDQMCEWCGAASDGGVVGDGGVVSDGWVIFVSQLTS